jgi:PLP dependent protein
MKVMNKIRENLLKIKEDVAPYTPNIIAVTKYFDESKIIEAYEAGLRDFGEAKVLEAVEKIQRLPKDIRENSKFHLIGHLQSNKVKKALGNFDYIHSVDSLNLAQAISQEALKMNICQKVFLQVNNANEVQKFGFLKDELFEQFGKIIVLDGIEVVGLMNMAPLESNKQELNRLFKDIAETRDKLEKQFDCTLKEISMGMSGDYKEASVAGATMIRIGRKLFSQ